MTGDLDDLDLGYANYPYAAQTMLTSHREGMDVGDLGHPSLGVVTDLNDPSTPTFKPNGHAPPTSRESAMSNPMSAEDINALTGQVAGLAAAGINLGIQKHQEAVASKTDAQIATYVAPPAPPTGGSSPTTALILGGVAALAGIGILGFLMRGEE